MSLTIPIGSTVTITGGTTKTYTPDGVQVTNGAHLIDASETDFRIRPSIVVRYVAPKLLADGSYTKGKLSAARTLPQILASGKTVFNVVRAEIELHPEAAAAVLLEMRKQGANMLTASCFDNFWAAGSLVF